MRPVIFLPSLFIGVCLSLSCGISAQIPVSATQQKVSASLPIVFEENHGQFGAATRYIVRNAGGTVEFRRNGPEFLIGKAQGRTRITLEPDGPGTKTELVAEEATAGKVNYFLGQTTTAQLQGIPTYGKLRYGNFMPGVDLTFYGTGNDLEHDFVLAPQVDPSSVRFMMKGANSVQLNPAGELVIHTADSQLLFRKPVAYQIIADKRTPVDADFEVTSKGTISFRIGKYNRDKALVIDPVLVFSTYLDGTHADISTSITTDSSGNIYLAGSTTSPDFPTANAYQAVCGSCADGGSGEMGYVSKLDPTGTTLLYSTYFVGNGETDVLRIKVDNADNLVGVGFTVSTNFPHVGKYPGTYPYGAFVFSLNPAGTQLNHAEIVGAGPPTQTPGAIFYNPYGLAVDSKNNVYIADTTFLGRSDSGPYPFPVTAGTYGARNTSVIGEVIVFVAKLGPDGSLIYATLVPPTDASPVSAGFFDLMGGFAVDSNGNAYVAGTAYPGIPTTANTVSPAFPNGKPVNVAYSGGAGFVFALDANAANLLFATYLPGTDNANTISIAADGSLYIAGTTSETTLPVTANAFQSALRPGATCTCNGGYVMRLSADGSKVLNATYLSGTNDYNNELTEYGASAFDSKGNIYLGGLTGSADYPMVLPVVSFPDDTDNTSGGVTVLAGLSPDLSKLIFGSFFNGDGAGDHLVDMSVGPNDRLVFTGGTYSQTNFPTTPNVYQPNAPALDSRSTRYPHQFVASIDLATPAPAVCLSSRSVLMGIVPAGTTKSYTFTLTNCGNAPLNVTSLTSTSGLVTATPLINALAAGQSYTIQLNYSPVDSGTVNGYLAITTNAAVPIAKFHFSGQGQAPKISISSPFIVNPVPIPQAVLGSSPAATTQVAVLNSGNGGLNITSISVSSDFTQTNTCPSSLPGGKACGINISLASTTAGSKQGTLTIVSNDITNPILILPLDGTMLSAFPVPILTTLSEQMQVTGAANAQLQLTGTNFFPQSVVRVNGHAVTPIFLGNNLLRITLDPTTIASIGELPITVFNPGPGGGESVPQTLTLYQQIPTAGVAIVSVPSTGMLYLASDGSHTPARPNMVVPVDPATGMIGTPIAVGKDPLKLVASTDGSYLFVVNVTDSTIMRIALATNTVDRTFPIPPSVGCGGCLPPLVTDIQPVPGSPTKFVVAQGAYLSLYDDNGLVNELSTQFQNLNATNIVFAGNPAHVYSSPFSTTDNFFKQFTIDGTGIHALSTTGTASSVTNEADYSMAAVGSQIFTSSGHVWDSGTKQLLATIPLMTYSGYSYFSGMTADPNQSLVYYAGQTASPLNLAITAYDANTYVFKSGLTFSDPNMIYSLYLSRWGKDGFAFIDNNLSLVLFRSSSLSGTVLPAPSITFTVPTHAYGDAPVTVNATSNSTAPITYSVIAGQATINNNTVTFTGAGVVQIQASQAANSTFAAGSQVASFFVNPATLTLKANDATRVYGAPNPTFTGTVGATVNNDTLSEAFTTSATQTSPVGSYSILPSPTGPGSENYKVTVTNGTLTITQAGAAVTLTPGSTTVTAGQSTTLTIAVKSATTGVPTGTVILLDGGTTLTTVTLSNGSATYNAVLTSVGTHHLSAMYSGDVNFTTATITSDVSVVAGGPDTALTSSTSSQQAAPGAAVVYTLQLNPAAGSFPGPVSFSAQGLPSGFTASFSPSTITVGATTQTVQMTLQAPATKARVEDSPSFGNTRSRLSLALGLALVPLIGMRRLRRWRKRSRVSLGLWLLIVTAGAGITGCSSASSPSSGTTPPTATQTYTVTVTATSGAVQHQTTVILIW